MHTTKFRNLILAGSLSFESVDYRFTIPSIALFDIHSLSCEYGISELLKVILNSMQDFNALP